MNFNIKLLSYADLIALDSQAEYAMHDTLNSSDGILLCSIGHNLPTSNQRGYWLQFVRKELQAIAPEEIVSLNQTFASRLRLANPNQSPEWYRTKAKECRLITLNHMLVAVRAEIADRLHIRKLKGL